MKLARFAKGYRGQRRIEAENKIGWQVWVNGNYVGFNNISLRDLRIIYSGMVITCVTGNGIFIDSPA